MKTSIQTLAKTNATLANATGLTYRGVPDYNGADTVTVTANDNGNTGTGGALTDTRTVAKPLSSRPFLLEVDSRVSLTNVGSAPRQHLRRGRRRR